MSKDKRDIVIPSQFLGDLKEFKAGSGTFIEKGKIFSEMLGVLNKNGKYLNVVPLKGRYNPQVKDFVIGVVEEPLSSSWLVDIKGPYPALLHVNEVPWNVDFNETEKYLNKGDCIMAKVSEVNSEKKVQITMDDRNLFKIKNGHLIEVQPSKVPRIIGKKGSMIALLKKYTRCRIKVGQNGRIWIDGDEENVAKVTRMIRKIEKESLSYGLTDKIEELLKKENEKDVH